jgi:hypothetical protein
LLQLSKVFALSVKISRNGKESTFLNSKSVTFLSSGSEFKKVNKRVELKSSLNRLSLQMFK